MTISTEKPLIIGVRLKQKIDNVILLATCVDRGAGLVQILVDFDFAHSLD